MDAWGGAELTVTVAGEDVSCDVLYCTVDRSKNRLWDDPDAGIAQVTLLIGTDAQAADVGQVGEAVVVAVAYGAVNRNLFTGQVQRRRLEARPEAADRIILDCVDAFELLSRVNLRWDGIDGEHGDGESPNNRIARWLTEADWPIGEWSLDSSTYTCPGVLLDGNILRNIQVTALADGGDFFIDGDGVPTFLAWAWRTEGGAVAAVFSDRKLHDWVPYSTAVLHDDLDEVQNSVTGTRRAHDGEGVPQTVENSTSVAAYGMRGDALDDLELDDDSQVADRVTALVTLAGMPNPRFDAISVQPAADPARMWPRTIPVTYASLVAANRLWDDGTESAYYGHVIGEVWTFTPTDATVTFRVSGTGTWDANGPPRPPICVEIDAEGCLRVCEGTPCNDIDDVIFRDADGNPIGDPLPPGSLCDPEVCVTIPDGAVEVCFENEFGVACIPIDDPRLEALIWFDVLEPGPNLIERIDGDPIDGQAGYADSTLDAIPGGFDAMNATEAGGVIGVGHGTRLQAADLADGWTIDLWLYLADDLGEDTVIDLVDLGVVKLQLRWDTLTPFNALTVEVDDGANIWVTDNMVAPTSDAWQHWELRYNPAGGVIIVRLGGIIVHIEPFPHDPDDNTGEWGVSLPGGGRIGEVIVYGDRPLFGDYDETVIADDPIAYWTLAEESTPSALGAYDAAVVDSDPYAYWMMEAET